MHQVVDVPEMRFNVDRTRADQLGLTQQDVANSLLISLSGNCSSRRTIGSIRKTASTIRSSCRRPNTAWTSTGDLLDTPVHAGGARAVDQLLTNVAQLRARRHGHRWSITTMCSRSTMSTPTCRIATWAAWPAKSHRVLDEFRPKLPKGSFFETRGQVETMRTSFIGLGAGMVFAIVLVYFVMVVNFQSWLDPFIILMALARRALRHPADAVRHPDHHQRSVADGRYHEHRRGHGQ